MTTRRLSRPINRFELDDVIEECGVIGYDVGRKKTTSVTQRYRRKRLSLPSTIQYTQPLSHAIYSKARTRRLWRHKPLFPWRHSTCSMEIGWSNIGPLAVGVSLIGLEWPTVSTVIMAVMNDTQINDNVQTEGYPKYCQCQVQICVNVFQFYGLSLYLTESAGGFTR